MLLLAEGDAGVAGVDHLEQQNITAEGAAGAVGRSPDLGEGRREGIPIASVHAEPAREVAGQRLARGVLQRERRTDRL